MALNHSPSIITNGLITYLDFANRLFYQGSGLFGRDLASRFSYVFSHSSGFNNSFGGSYFFGSGLGHVLTLDSYPIPVNNFTYDVWCWPTATIDVKSASTSGNNTFGITGQKYIIDPIFYNATDAGAGISIGTNGVSFYEHSSGYLNSLLSNTLTFNSPVNILYTFANKTPTLFVNGRYISSGLESPKPNTYAWVYRVGSGSYGNFVGNLYSIKTYNRVLSVAEIAQNYNATKGRFGL